MTVIGARCRDIDSTDTIDQYAERRLMSPSGTEFVILSDSATLAVVLQLVGRDGWHILSSRLGGAEPRLIAYRTHAQ